MTEEQMIAELNNLYEAREYIGQATTAIMQSGESLGLLTDKSNATVVKVKTELAEMYHQLETFYDQLDSREDALRLELDKLQAYYAELDAEVQL